MQRYNENLRQGFELRRKYQECLMTGIRETVSLMMRNYAILPTFPLPPSASIPHTPHSPY